MQKLDAIIVGAGPVGLFLACRFAQLGLDFVILEARSQPARHSRAIGIHPPSLAHLEKLGVLEQLLARGVKVTQGQGFLNQRPIGSLDFSSLPIPYNYILSVPQYQTESVLRACLAQRKPQCLLTGVKVQSVTWQHNQITLSACSEDAGTDNGHEFSARYLIACDGQHSFVRQTSGISFKGKTYPDTYLMGDFADSTAFASDAALYLSAQGIVESFPLPGKLRRWVARTSALESPVADTLKDLVKVRCNLELNIETCSMLSAFKVHRYLADHFAGPGVLLAGDAAHVLSPIGGQGMNLGWLDAWDIASMFEMNQLSEADFIAYSQRRRQSALRAIKRAEFNMWMGRSSTFFTLQALTARAMVLPGVSGLAVRQFTMHGL